MAMPCKPVEFPASLTVGEQSVNCNVILDTNGAILKLKQGNVILPRSEWLSEAASTSVLYLRVFGYSYADWIKKLKFETKNPGQTKNDFPQKPIDWTLTFSPKKIGPDAVNQIQQNVLRTNIENYVADSQDQSEIIIACCPTCLAMMDISPYADQDTLYCNNCSRFLLPSQNKEQLDYGVCTGCQYYTKLTANNAAQGKAEANICYKCRSKNTLMAFLSSFGITVLIGLVNVLTIVFANRFFPALILLAGVALIWSFFNLIRVIMINLTRSAMGVTPLEKATAAVRRGNTTEALKIVETIPNATANPGILLNMARGLIIARDFTKARQFTDLLTQQFPNFQPGFAIQLEALLKTGASAEEISQAEAALREVLCRNLLKTPEQVSKAGN